MIENKNNENNISLNLSSEINEIYSKTIIKEIYISPETKTNIKVVVFIYKNYILKQFKISIGKEIFISNENKDNNKIISESKNNNNKYKIEYDNSNDYYFTVNLGEINPSTTIEIESIYLNFIQNEGNKYISNIFKRYPLILVQNENKNLEFINFGKIEGEIFLKTQNKIESFHFNIIPFNDNLVNEKTNVENNFLNDDNISINTIKKQYNSPKDLYIKYQLKGIEHIKEYSIYEFLNDFIPIIKIEFIASSMTLRKSELNNKKEKIILFNQKINEKVDKNINILHYKYSLNENKNNIIEGILNDGEDPVIYPNKYIFVIDESISMAGEKIAKIRGAVKLLLFSLNSNSEYQIIGFNDSIRMYDGTFKHAIKNNIIKSLEYLSNIYVDNKKCNLFPVIKLIYYLCNKNKNIPINIFLFTNAICDKIDINRSLNIIYENSIQNNFHLNIFALGKEYNKYFVVSGSIFGNGNYYLINKLKELNKEVISEFSNCYNEYYSNINSKIPKSIIDKDYKTNEISQINVFDNNNPLNLFFISKNINNNDIGILKFKIHYKKYFNEKFALQNTNLTDILLGELSFGDDLYILYLYKIFYENYKLNEESENKIDNNGSNNFYEFSSFLKGASSIYGINFNNLEDIFYYDKNNILNLINKNFINSNISSDNNIKQYIKQNNKGKDYFEISTIKEKKYHDFLLVDEFQEYSESSRNEKNKNKFRPERTNSSMTVGDIFKGIERVGSSIAVLGKNIGKAFSSKKLTDLKDIKNIRPFENDEDDLEDNYIDNYKGNKYGYDNKDKLFMNAIFSQDLEGFWEEGNKKLIKIEEKYKEMNNNIDLYLMNNIKNIKINIKIDDKNTDVEIIKSNIKMTFMMIVDIINDHKEKINEFSFIIQKGKKYIKKYGFFFHLIVKDNETNCEFKKIEYPLLNKTVFNIIKKIF